MVEEKEYAIYMGKLMEIWPFRAVGGRKHRVSNESMGVSSRKVDMRVESLIMPLLRGNSGNVQVDRHEMLYADRQMESRAKIIRHIFTTFCNMEQSQMLLYHTVRIRSEMSPQIKITVEKFNDRII